MAAVRGLAGIGAGAALWLALAASASGQQSGKASDWQALEAGGAEACFGRVYDKAHLKAHPNQKVQRIFFYRGDDPVSHPNEEPSSGSSYDSYLTTTERGAKKPEWVGAWCGAGVDEDGNPQGIHCGMECDRTLASLRFDAKGRLIVEKLDRYVYLDPSETAELEEEQYEKLALGTDDDGFALERRPAAECRAEFAKVDPIDPALGEPLRLRLKPDQPFCYGRDYTAAHLASNPQQVTKTIRVFRGPSELASYAAAGRDLDNWPNGADIMVSVATRKASGTSMQSYSCDGEGDQWRCVATTKTSDADCDISSREIYLRRGAKGAMMLSNPANGLPLIDLCSAEAAEATASDDRIYRLEPMQPAECGL
jgi:hypothetical protein